MAVSSVQHYYLGRGLAAARSDGSLFGSAAIGFYLSTDTGAISYWDGSAWQNMTAFGLSVAASANAGAARTTLGLAIGTNVQAYNANLTTYAGIAPSANVQTLLGAADFSAFRTSLTVYSTSQVDSAIATAVTGLLDLKGGTDCSANPNYPAASKGDVYAVTVAGKIGGGSGKSVDVGDVYIASADNAGGTEASVGTSWFVLEHNLLGSGIGDVVGPGSATDGRFAAFDGTTGKLIKELTAATATATLNAMVGDSGSGGTKGLAPAPGAGDAAASKFLKADGTWDVPTGSGTVADFTDLGDVPASYSGQTLKAVRVNAGETALEFYTPSGGGSGKYFKCFKPKDNEPPASNYATEDLRNNRPVLEFDTTTQEAAIFTDAIPSSYGGTGLTVEAYYGADTATSGTIGWDIALERSDASGLDTDSDSFATAQTITAATVPGTSGQTLKSSVVIANGSDMDSLAAGELYRVRIRRDVANDTAGGDAQLFALVVRET